MRWKKMKNGIVNVEFSEIGIGHSTSEHGIFGEDHEE
jgi:hypothetical protein